MKFCKPAHTTQVAASCLNAAPVTQQLGTAAQTSECHSFQVSFRHCNRAFSRLTVPPQLAADSIQRSVLVQPGSMAAERGVLLHAAVEVKGLSQDGFPASYSAGRVSHIFKDGGLAVERCTVTYDDVRTL